jgi:hypothetical protein
VAARSFSGLIGSSSTSTIGIPYHRSIGVRYISDCLLFSSTTLNWSEEYGRSPSLGIVTSLVSTSTFVALGGDCVTADPDSDWSNPERFAEDTVNPGKPTAMDALNRYMYVGIDQPPHFLIASTTSAFLGQNGGLILPLLNGFSLDVEPNSIDTARMFISGTWRTYVFAAMDRHVDQLEVIDVTDPANPMRVATRSLSPCVTGSFPEGWALQYYAGRLYFLTRETAGPELHIFNVEDPTNPTEYGSGACLGYSLNATAEDIAVRDVVLPGGTYRIAFLATNQNSRELRVLNVTNPAAPVELGASTIDLVGNQDGLSVRYNAGRVYLGRQSSPGADLYVYDASNPLTGLPLLGSVDVGTSVTGIRLSPRYMFLATTKVNSEFQVWDARNPAAMTLVRDYNFGNVVGKGIDYETDFIYSVGQATPNIQILYGAP